MGHMYVMNIDLLREQLGFGNEHLEGCLSCGEIYEIDKYDWDFEECDFCNCIVCGYCKVWFYDEDFKKLDYWFCQHCANGG